MNNDYNKNLENRFLKYVSFETTSDESSNQIPSTPSQKDLAKYLVNELHTIGLKNAYMDEYGYVYAYLESNCNSQNTLGLIAHMDTSEEASGKNVTPQIIECYNGKDIVLNKKLNIIMQPSIFTSLNEHLSHRIITTDGTTLLGADDKAGIAIIMTLIEELINDNEHEYPNIIITFTPDEEIGEGTRKFNFDYYKTHHCDIAYTLDGDDINIINYENFNAASAEVNINGKSIHPGSAKGKMINSILVAMEFNELLPIEMRPSLTDGYEGFNHLLNINGNVSSTSLTYIIRNHNMNTFNEQIKFFTTAQEFINNKYHEKLVSVKIHESYLNMKDIVLQKPYLIENAKKALKEHQVEPLILPIRGGTDGARLSFGGITTPNLGTGGDNYHGVYEYLDITNASKMVNVLKSLLKLTK